MLPSLTSTAAWRVRAWESRASSAARTTICSASWLSWRFSGRHWGPGSGCMSTTLRETSPDQAGEGRGPGDGPEPGRRRAQRLVLAVGQVDVGGGHVALELLQARGAGYGHHGGSVDGPGQRDLGGCGRVRVCHLAQGRDQVAGPL